jgi:hypothetical protein
MHHWTSMLLILRGKTIITYDEKKKKKETEHYDLFFISFLRTFRYT